VVVIARVGADQVILPWLLSTVSHCVFPQPLKPGALWLPGGATHDGTRPERACVDTGEIATFATSVQPVTLWKKSKMQGFTQARKGDYGALIKNF
jgi:hypothetical protein